MNAFIFSGIFFCPFQFIGAIKVAAAHGNQEHTERNAENLLANLPVSRIGNGDDAESNNSKTEDQKRDPRPCLKQFSDNARGGQKARILLQMSIRENRTVRTEVIPLLSTKNRAAK